MGFGDKLKKLREQAGEAVSEHKDQIHSAMDVAESAVNQKTHGKYAAKIARIGEKADDAVEKIAAENAPEGTAPAAPAAGTAQATEATEASAATPPAAPVEPEPIPPAAA